MTFHTPFSVFGTTLDLMIVDTDTLAPKPLAAALMADFGAVNRHFLSRGMFNWKSRPQPHMIRLQSAEPLLNLNALDHGLADEVQVINEFLRKLNARLMPGGVHPWASPDDLQYDQTTSGHRFFSRHFDCRGHGWRNACSAYLDMPFTDDDTFTRLHAAVRVVLPLIPALTASSPILQGKTTGWLSHRFELDTERFRQHPEVCGKLIPEPVFTERRYRETILAELESVFRMPEGARGEPVSAERINRRGAVPFFSDRFLRIRIGDPQECPAADMAVFKLIIEAVRAQVNERFTTFEEQMGAPMGDLVGILRDAAVGGMKAEVISSGYLSFFGMDGPATIGDIWKNLFDLLSRDPVKPLAMYEHELSVILEQGALADRILTVLGDNPAHDEIRAMWVRLCDCLEQNRLLIL